MATVLAGATAANALTSPTHFRPPADSLGALAAPINLRIGNAVNMDKLNVDAAYTSLVANQYSSGPLVFGRGSASQRGRLVLLGDCGQVGPGSNGSGCARSGLV